MLLLLLSRFSFSYYCKISLNVTTNVPESFEGPLGDGDRLCINSTLPYLSVTFQPTTLLKVRYFSRDGVSGLVETSGHFFIPSETAALGFSATIGHIEVQALTPGIVSLSTFAYPPECSQSRYFTTMEDDSFNIAARLSLGDFAAAVSEFACLWSPHPRTGITGIVNSESRNAVRICDVNGCTNPWESAPDGDQSLEFSATQYLKIDANAPDFLDKATFTLSVKKRVNFLEAYGLFPSDDLDATVKLMERPASDEHPLMELARPFPKAPPAAAPPPADDVAKRAIGALQREAQVRSSLGSILAVLQIVALSVAIVGGLLCIVYHVMPDGRRDDAEAGLLGSAPAQARFPHFFPQGYGTPGFQGQPYQFPYPQAGPAAFPAAQFPQAPEPGVAAQPQ